MKLGLTWNQPLGRPECPYMRRWVVNLGVCSFRVHHWQRSDDKRYLHDHPWAFTTLVLRGGYTDVSRRDTPASNWPYDKRMQWFMLHNEYQNPPWQFHEDWVSAGHMRYRPALHAHYVDPKPDTWTLIITGPVTNKWGFWVNGKKKAVRSFFWKYGHPPCD